MRLLFCGDVVGRSGRDAVLLQVPALRRRFGLDFVVANGENAAHGFGITPKICEELFDGGVDVVTLGNHAWDQREIIPFLDADPRVLRPRNYPAGTPGRGAGIYAAPRGKKVMVVQVMGRLFMDPLDDPFAAVEAELLRQRLGTTVHAVILTCTVRLRAKKWPSDILSMAAFHWWSVATATSRPPTLRFFRRNRLSDRRRHVRRLRTR